MIAFESHSCRVCIFVDNQTTSKYFLQSERSGSMLEPSDELVLRAGTSELGIVPSLGSAVSHWRVGAWDILRPGRASNGNPLRMACFAMVPFSNVIDGGGLQFLGEFFPLAPNHPAEPLPIHGDAWLASWQVDNVSDRCAETHYAHDGRQGFPFAYLVRQQIRLDKTMLRMSLVLRNTDHRPMPAGLGIHPYFCKSAGTRLQATHRGRWTGNDVAADERFLLPGELPEAEIDDCFVGWTGFAYLTGRHEGMQIAIQSSEVARNLVVYSPAQSDFVCVEPVSNVNDGINAFARGVPDTGVRVLEPGMSMGLTTMIQVDAPMRGSQGPG